MQLRLGDRQRRKHAGWHWGGARGRNHRRAVRESAESAVRTICAGWRQVLVQVDGLHKAEAGDHDQREYGGPSLPPRLSDLGRQPHRSF
jgi:hypothetical protein